MRCSNLPASLSTQQDVAKLRAQLTRTCDDERGNCFAFCGVRNRFDLGFLREANPAGECFDSAVMRFFSKLFESDDETLVMEPGEATAQPGAQASQDLGDGGSMDAEKALLRASATDLRSSPQATAQVRHGHVGSPTMSLPAEVLAVRRAANPWAAPLSVPAGVANSASPQLANGSSVESSAKAPQAQSSPEHPAVRTRSDRTMGARSKGGVDETQSWAKLRPPADSHPFHRPPIPKEFSSALEVGELAPPEPTQPKVVADTAQEFPTAFDAKNTQRRLPKVIVRVTTRPQQIVDLVEAREDDEEPTDPGMGVPSTVVTPHPAQSPQAPAVKPSAPKLTISKKMRDRLVMHVLLGTIRGLSPALRTRLVGVENCPERIAQSPITQLSATLGTSEEMASVLRATCKTYAELKAARKDSASNLSLLEKALTELQLQSKSFNECDEDDRKLRRKRRQAVQDAVTAVNLLVAESGDQALLHDLERHSIAERIALLRAQVRPTVLNS